MVCYEHSEQKQPRAVFLHHCLRKSEEDMTDCSSPSRPDVHANIGHGNSEIRGAG